MMAATGQPQRRKLTRAEQRMWFLEQLAPQRPSANLCNGFVIHGKLDIEYLNQCIKQVIGHHAALRSRFFSDAEQNAVCEVVADAPFCIEVETLSGQHREQREQSWRQQVPKLAKRPFDLACAPLLRLHLAELAPQEHVALLVMHHIISDGDYSAEVFMRETIDALVGRNSTPPVSAFDSAEQPEPSVHLDFWREYLDDAPQSITLPSLEDTRSWQCAVNVDLPASMVKELKKLAQQNGLRLFDILLATFGQLLKTHSAQKTILIAWPDPGRAPDMQQPGYFGQPLPLRLDMGDGQSFIEHAQAVKASFARVMAHRTTPFASIVNAVATTHQSRMPLFQTMFDFQQQLKPIVTPALVVHPQWWDIGVTEYEWSLFLFEQDDGAIRGRMEYQPERFGRHMMQAVTQRYLLMLGAVTDNPNQVAFTPLTPEDQQQARAWGQGPQVPIPRACAHQLFEAQVARTPQACAMVFGQQRITYQALNEAANRAARQLRSLGLKPGMIVGLYLPRGTQTLTMLLAVWKAGAAILPLDPAYPAARLELMLADSQAAMVISERALTDRLALPSQCPWVLTDDLAEQGKTQSSDNLNLEVGHDDLNYIIYTSGSTGMPKGIAMVHRCLVNLVQWQLQDSPMRQDIRALQFASLNFDICYQEMFCTWAAGGTVVLIDEPTRRDARLLLDYVIAHEINRLFLPFVVLDQLAIASEVQGRVPKSLREILTAGEQLRSTPALRHLLAQLPDCRLYNQYGPSEAHVITSLTLGPDPKTWPDLPPVGYSLANTDIVLVDAALKPVPPGAPGEVLTAGAGLARGYLNRPELTQASFIDYPWPEAGATRAYRTGDLARFHADGSLSFLRRVDQQYKVRGFRIDLGEIESVISQHPNVQQALTIVRGQTASAQIIAYVVPQPTKTEDAGLEASQIEDWQNLWDITYSDSIDSTFNLAGWVSSYTEQPLPTDQMRQWRDETVARILALKPKRVLELGCGAGLLLTEIAPHCDFYGASDLSPAVVQQLQARVAKIPGLKDKVELRQAQAIDLASWPVGSFNTIVLNSVVQLFPSEAYLREVIDRALTLLAPGGRIFIGDVQNLDLLAAYHAGVQASRYGHWPIAKIRKAFNDALVREDQLIIAPDFFYQLPAQTGAIKAIDLNLKRSAYDNELTRFRYDVVLHTSQKPAQPGQDLVLPYEGTQSLDAVAQKMAQPGVRAVGIQAIPNQRLQSDLFALDCLHREDWQDQLFNQLKSPLNGQAINPAVCWDLAKRLNLHCHVTWSATPDCIDVWWTSDPAFTCPRASQSRLDPLTNDPLELKRQRAAVDDLKQYLKARLPEHMIPSHVMLVAAIPVKTNGKVDLDALPEPHGGIGPQQVAPTSPTEQMLADLWQQTLGIDNIGIDDDFFALGGHSLLGVELLHRIRQHCALEIALSELFDKRTIRALAAQIDARKIPADTEIDEGVL